MRIGKTSEARQEQSDDSGVDLRKVPKKEVIQFGDNLMMHSERKRELVRQIEQSQSSYATNDLPFRDRSESKSEEFGFGYNPFRKDISLSPYSPRFYS